MVQTAERSGLEQDLGQTVTLVQAKRALQEGQAEAQLYAGDPYGMRTAAPGQPLPAPPVSSQLIAACIPPTLHLPLAEHSQFYAHHHYFGNSIVDLELTWSVAS